MSHDWVQFDPARIKVVSWPPARSVAGGREQVEWILETLDDVPARWLNQGLGALRPSLRSAVLEGQFEVRGDGLMSCAFEYDVSVPVTERLGAASVLWRRIDEGLARLWRVGEVPRAELPAFKQQRRELIRRLPDDLRMFWMCASLVRIEPLLAGFAGRASSAAQLLDLLAAEDSPRRFVDAVRPLVGDGGRGTATFAVAGEHVGEAVAGVTRNAREAFGSKAVNDMAACTEDVLEVFFLVDQGSGATSRGSSRAGRSGGISARDSLGRQEDRSWWKDAHDLINDGISARGAIAARAADQAVALASLVEAS